MIVFLFGFLLLALALVYHYATRKYLNPYKLTFIFAKKGAGKSTLLTKLAIQHINNGWSVYSTERIPGCYLIDYKHRLTRAHREKQLKMSCQALHNAPPNRT